MPPKYAAGQKWGLFLPTPTDRHRGRVWSQFLPMFDLLISYFPNSNIQMYRGKTIPYHTSQSVKYNDSISVEHTHYEVKFRKLFREIMDKASKGSDTVQRHIGDLSAVSESEENKETLTRTKRHHKHLSKFKLSKVLFLFFQLRRSSLQGENICSICAYFLLAKLN